LKLHWRIATGLPVIFQEVCVRVLSLSLLGLDVPEAEGRAALPAPPEVTDIRRAVGA